MDKGFIKYTVIIAVILGIAFLSQKIYTWENAKTFLTEIPDQTGAYLKNAYKASKDTILPKIGGEVGKGKEAIADGIEQQKQKVSENISEKIKNYFSGIGESIVHPGTPQNCPEPTSNALSNNPPNWYKPE
jgi:hypothetical protein